MFSFFYELALWVLTLAMAPKLLYQRWKYGKYKRSLAQRFGKDFPTIDKKDRPLVWIHAVSVGETKAVAALAKKYKQDPRNPIVVISSVTETGHAEAQRCISFADYHVYLPLDFKWVVQPIVDNVKPDVVILCETDFWYNFLNCCKKNGAFIAVVNGKLSVRSLERYKQFSFFSKRLFDLIDLFCVQNSLYSKRFEQLGIPSDQIVVTGNIKFDEEVTKLSHEELEKWKKQFGISHENQVLVCGSTHAPEEEIILAALDKVWNHFPQLKVLIVPRHPERFNEVAQLLTKKEIPFARFSAMQSITGKERVVLVDAMGILRKCYQLADLALVAGSYTPRVGGHNIIEPSWFGVPVIFGPHMHTQLELVELVNEYAAGEQVTPDQLSSTFVRLLGDPNARHALGQGGIHLVHDLRGATNKTWEGLKNHW